MSLSNAHPGIPASSADLEILRAFEPIVRYTKGEKFYPMAVEPYVQASSLWLYVADGADEELVAEGELSLDGLVEPRDAPFGSLFYLRFVQPLDLHESTQALAEARQLAKREQNEFHAGVGRLARGGLLPRLGDGLFSLSLLLRGNVPGATAAAAALKYAQIREQDGRFVYQGRVVRQSGWTICQYWFFFAYNPWRSGFNGVNDHESDWEMISVYLYEEDGRLRPEWVAYASHDFHGADLRRRWDDPVDLERQDEHPVVYAGAGSHASYFKRGEYQAEVPIPSPRQFKRAAEAIGRLWRTTLGQGDDTSPLRIPFIDFARGDGISIGPGQPNEWTPNVIDETTAWAASYRGMWGLYAQDPISGENAPAGPMYERDGSPRPSWFDPLGFAGLDRVPPPPAEIAALESESARLESRQQNLARLIPEETASLQESGVRLESMHGSPHLAAESLLLEAEVAAQAAKLRDMRRERSANQAVLESLRRRSERRRAGDVGEPQAHITHAAEPVPPATMRFHGAAELWAALSISLLLIGLAVLILAAPTNVWSEGIILVIAFIVGESVLRGSFTRTVNRLAVIAALVAIVVLFVQYWEFALVGLLLWLAVFLLYQRFRELVA
jgi:hypothetical protein